MEPLTHKIPEPKPLTICLCRLRSSITSFVIMVTSFWGGRLGEFDTCLWSPRYVQPFYYRNELSIGKEWLNRGSIVLTGVKHNGRDLNRGPIGLMFSSIGLRIARALAFMFAIALE